MSPLLEEAQRVHTVAGLSDRRATGPIRVARSAA